MNDDTNVSRALIQLLKGVIYYDSQPDLWTTLLDNYTEIKEYFAKIGLRIILDEAEGYTFLQQEDFEDAEEIDILPKLIQRRPLGYQVSLLCVMLRKKMLESDISGGEARVILTKDEIIDGLKVFFNENHNEAKITDQITAAVTKAEELGFLRKLKDETDKYEINRIIKAFINADTLNEIDKKLTEYCNDYTK